MELRQDVVDWLQALDADCVNIAVGDGGLDLVALDADGNQVGPYYEIGGIPIDD